VNQDEEGSAKGSSSVSAFWKGETKKEADINIFTVASGHLYEVCLQVPTRRHLSK
jgi:hypothetical protein